MTSLPSPSNDQAYCVVSALEAGHLNFPMEMFIDNAVPGYAALVPSLSFLLRHSKTDKKFIFDLGVRKDFENYPPAVQKLGEVFSPAVPQDVAESVIKGGLSPSDVDTVCISHCHWDHVGNPKHFPNSEFIVGAAADSLFRPGYPEDPNSGFSSDLLPAGRTRFVELSDQPPLGPFPHAFDFYGDGSVYIVDAAGHLLGHVVLVVRTSADGGWILLGGDSAHHWNLITGESKIADGLPVFGGGCVHMDKKAAELTIQRIREFSELPRTRVILAHDEPWYKANKDTSFWPAQIRSDWIKIVDSDTAMLCFDVDSIECLWEIELSRFCQWGSRVGTNGTGAPGIPLSSPLLFGCQDCQCQLMMSVELATCSHSLTRIPASSGPIEHCRRTSWYSFVHPQLEVTGYQLKFENLSARCLMVAPQTTALKEDAS
ncbi:beta-lactamase-like protein [Rhodocollybia butyracea]|uniref:Beta-lactamase-like protein n=1 Tax=Rhodocollybia butyracea TaxID=206335 RepID=A0A9P5UFT6_9AGAR|nr:beta-lactamase-like protein [Rhodocollybia butyracea]